MSIRWPSVMLLGRKDIFEVLTTNVVNISYLIIISQDKNLSRTASQFVEVVSLRTTRNVAGILHACLCHFVIATNSLHTKTSPYYVTNR